jgi:hypothetical protein
MTLGGVSESPIVPLYDRWLYPLERANNWITRQILQHGYEESTVMQTYSVSHMQKKIMDLRRNVK